MDKALIERGSIELVELFDLVSEEAKKEKNAIPPINKILYWWTRKPLIVARTIILLSILRDNTDPSKAKLLLNLDSDKRAYTHKLNLSSLLYDGLSITNIKVLDPFAGAGNLIFEAKEFGFSFDCYAMDYNPVAYLIEKAVLEYPSKYPNLARDVEYYANKVIEETRKELGHLYHRRGRKALAYLYSWCILCPYCKQRIPLMNHSWFANTDKKRIGIRVKPNNNKDFVIELVNNISEEEGEKYTQKGGRAVCINCKSSIDYDHLTNDIANRKDYAMIGVVVQGLKGKDYELPNEDDIRAFNEAKKLLEERWKEFEDEGLIPFEGMGEELFRIKNYGFTQWYQIFNPRQLLLMLTLLKNIKRICSDIKYKEYAKVIATYLAFMLCKHIDFNCISIGWHVTNQQISHALAMREPRIIYNFAETNPFEKTSGSLKGMLDNIVDAIKFASNNNGNVKVSLASVLHLPYNNEFDLIITDPPYLDDVTYGEISEFFYVWLYRALKDYYPELPNRVPLDEDIVLSKGRFGNKKLAYQFYEKAMKQAFKNIHKALKDDGLAVIFFAHSSLEAWNLLLDILREAGFQVTSSYAVHTENEQNVLARNKTSFMSSIVIACRKISKDRSRGGGEAYFEDLIPTIEDKIDELLKGINADKLLEIPITDLLIMIYGEVLEVATAYTRLKSYSKDINNNITFEDIMNNVRDYMLRAVIKKLIDRDLNIIGAEAAFYIVGRIFFNGIIPADDALHMMRTYNISNAVLNSIAKRDKGAKRLLSFKDIKAKELEEINANNIHEQLMFIEQVAYKDGARKVKSIINAPNFRVNELKSIIALLLKYYNLSKNKGRKLSNDEEDEYNILLALADVLDLRVDSANKRIDEYG